ncbi:mitochondrial 37S ribosomal protein rsm10 [Coemansia javaensis]|uniref:Mitochondrial 37S ribosomal protein rsm10 n=1 Tax=Coemansia javaensis TaxID=2761396 RepID=A0A9W8LJE8_9FUNG|nr:mitochondrial 37S ribosomal protein rsm10 [Coemansia javaensis]
MIRALGRAIPGAARARVVGGAVRGTATYARLLDKVLGINVHEKTKVVAQKDRDPIYADPVNLPKTHGIPICRVAFWSFQLQRMDFYMDFCRKAAYHMGVVCAGPVPMPTVVRRWTVLKSPFVHKSSMEVFERRTHKRVLFVRDTHPEVAAKWLEYINANIPVGVGMKYWMHEYEPLDIGDRIAQALQTGDTTSVDAQSLESTRYLEHVVKRGRRRMWTTYKDLPVYSRDAVAAMAADIASKLKADPKANIEEVTQSVLTASRPPPEKKKKPAKAPAAASPPSSSSPPSPPPAAA